MKKIGFVLLEKKKNAPILITREPKKVFSEQLTGINLYGGYNDYYSL